MISVLLFFLKKSFLFYLFSFLLKRGWLGLCFEKLNQSGLIFIWNNFKKEKIWKMMMWQVIQVTWLIDHFRIAVTAFYNDCGLNFYSVSLTMKLNIPKFQCNFTVFTTAYIVGGVTSRSLSKVLLNIYQQNEANTVKLSLLSLLKAATSDVKMVYCSVINK